MSERIILIPSVSSPTRRQWIGAVSMAVGGLALVSTESWAVTDEEISHAAESIHMEPVFKASRKRVYEALTDARQFNKVVELSAAVKTGMVPAGNPGRSAQKRAERSRSSVAILRDGRLN